MVDGFYGGDSWWDLAAMPDHIGIRKIYDHHIKSRVLYGLDYRVGNSGSTHFRLQVVGRNLWRLHHNAVFACERLFHPTVEEVCDVRVFLGLRHAEIAHVELTHHVGQDV